MDNDKRWGILYCPKHDDKRHKSKRWNKIDKCLRDNGIDFDYVQSESMAGVRTENLFPAIMTLQWLAERRFIVSSDFSPTQTIPPKAAI